MSSKTKKIVKWIVMGIIAIVVWKKFIKKPDAPQE